MKIEFTKKHEPNVKLEVYSRSWTSGIFFKAGENGIRWINNEDAYELAKEIFNHLNKTKEKN